MTYWEIESFHLTVGDGCRKLGGHDQDITQYRNGDSCLLNDESGNELQGCKKPKSKIDPWKLVIEQDILILLKEMMTVMLQVILLRLL